MSTNSIWNSIDPKTRLAFERVEQSHFNTLKTMVPANYQSHKDWRDAVLHQVRLLQVCHEHAKLFVNTRENLELKKVHNG